MNSESKYRCAEQLHVESEEGQLAPSAIERIIARELEPLRDELARLRTHVAALRDSFIPW